MQVLKEEVRQRIIKSSRKEFKKNGFEKASMRTIADSAKMTVGNLYRYYKNKEDLFSGLVVNLNDQIKKLTKESANKSGNDKFEYLIGNLETLVCEFQQEWVILFKDAAGTKYAKVADQVKNLLGKCISEILESEGGNSSISGAFSSAIISGFNHIADKEKKETAEVAASYVAFMKKDFVKRSK